MFHTHHALHLAVIIRWFTEGKKDWSLQIEDLDFVRKLLDAPIDKSIKSHKCYSTKIKNYTKVQPYQFGHRKNRSICLWLNNLPKLRTNKYCLKVRGQRIWKMPPSKNRSKLRSVYFIQVLLKLWRNNGIVLKLFLT